MVALDDVPKKKLPVTLLSGFLGSGKTTLLEYILTSNHGLGRIAVIVNDMASLNIDAALLANHNVSRTETRMVEMQSGCICCTLRGDLVEEVARLAERGDVDYLVIESTGISEPQQVAEAFSEEFADMHVQAGLSLQDEAEADDESRAQNARLAEILAGGGLTKVARLDTCVTVVDALNVFANFDSADFLRDDRAISELMAQQWEFASVLVINKCDLVPASEVERIKSLVRTLNPSARILTSTRCRIDLRQILDTGLFSYAEAAMSAGWLKSLQEEVKPESEEYGIGSFVYRARRPFHPTRLWSELKRVFVIAQAEYMDDGADDGEDESEDEGEDEGDDEAMSQDEGRDGGKGADEEEEEEEGEERELDTHARAEAKRNSPTWSGVLRSKGFFWLATRPLLFGEWSSAGVMLTLLGGQRWRCEVAREQWPDDPKVVEAIERDFDGEWGDRRQEIVFIGTDMSKGGEARIREAMDACLLNDEEMGRWEKVMRGKKGKRAQTWEQKQEALQEIFPDGFEDWDDEEEEEGDWEDDEEAAKDAKGAKEKKADANGGGEAQKPRPAAERKKQEANGHAHHDHSQGNHHGHRHKHAKDAKKAEDGGARKDKAKGEVKRGAAKNGGGKNGRSD